ncbi:MAG: magnesium/cobalt transporter CorA [Actinomycetota bacterium]
MITSRIYRDGALEEEAPFDPADVEACRAAGDRRIWIDVVDPTDEELSLLQRTLGLHELSVEDSRRWGQRSKVEFYPGYVFLVVHGIHIDQSGELVDSEMHAFAGEQFYLLTIRRAPLLELRKTVERTGRISHLASEGIGFHLYLLLDEIVDGYLDVVDHLEDQADAVEEDVFSEEEEVEGLQERIFRTKRKVVEFRRAVAPLREVIDLLDERGDLVTPPLVPYYRDVLDHVIRSQEMIDNIRELLTGALDVRMAQASNRLNIVMKQLSAWAAIILIPTLIAGIYGMNFRHMPELDWKLGYPFALGVMGASAFTLYRVFRRRDWL